MLSDMDKEQAWGSSFDDFILRIPEGCEARVEDGKVIFHKKYWEPKFKIGDWITDGQHLVKIFNTDSYLNQYYFVDTDGEESNLVFSYVDKEYRLWTIDDVMAGDVIVYSDEHDGQSVELIKKASKCRDRIEFWICLAIGEHCDMCYEYTLYTDFASRKNATPATKAQRDYLFQKIKDANYEWDAKRLELKKKWVPAKGETVYIVKMCEDSLFFCVYEGRLFDDIKQNELDKYIEQGVVFRNFKDAGKLCQKINEAVKPVMDGREDADAECVRV